MPVFVDAHALVGITKEQLQELQKAEKDKFGVTHVNIHYNLEDERAVCILDAPDKQAVIDHHKEFGIDCDFVFEKHSTA